MKLTNSWAVTYSLRYIVEAQRSKENMLMNKWLICGRNDFNNRRTARDMSARSGGGSIVVASIDVGPAAIEIIAAVFCCCCVGSRSPSSH